MKNLGFGSIKDFAQGYSQKFRWIPFFILLMLFFSGIRLVHINADSSPDISVSAAPFTDEALKTYSPRNYTLFGTWKWSKEDGYSSWFSKSPVPTWLYSFWFKNFGVSYSSIRVLNVIFSILTMTVLFFLVKRFYDIFQAFVALTIYGINAFLIMFNRLGFLENMLNFFILLIFYSFCSLYEHRGRMKRAFVDKTINVPKEFLYIVLAIIVGCIATVSGIFTKQSISVVVVAIVPFLTLYLFYSHNKLNSFLRIKFYITVLIIVIGYVALGHFGLFDKFYKDILSIKIFDLSIGYLIPLKRTSANFDSIYLSFIKSLFLEFVFMQPVVFFTGILYALYVYYRFLYKKDLHILDTAFATWFLFGFLFLTIMRYHPARYYMLVTMPLIILSTRFFTCGKMISAQDFFDEKSRFFSLRKLLLALYVFYLLFYIAIVVAVHLVPFAMRKAIYDFFYFNILAGNIRAIIPVVVSTVMFLIIIYWVSLLLIRNIKRLGVDAEFKKILFVALIIIQTFTYMKWYVNDQYIVVNYSRSFGRHLPKNSVLAGCWAPALVIENDLRSLVIQEKMHYNVPLTEKIASGQEVETVPYLDENRNKLDSGPRPIYLLVSQNAPFDRKIVKHFKKYLIPERLLTSFTLGFFDVGVYRLDRPVSIKRRKLIADECKN